MLMIKKFIYSMVLCLPFLSMANNNVFMRKGIEIVKPDGWHWMGYKSLQEATEGQEGDRTRPIIVITKHEEPYDGLNASLTVKRSTGLLSKSPRIALSNLHSAIVKNYGKEAIIFTPKRITIDGLEAFAYRYKFKFETGGKTYFAANETIVLKYAEDTYYIFESSAPVTKENDYTDLDILYEKIAAVRFTDK